MKPVFASIFALLFIVPFHTMSYVKTMLHVAHHEHEHEHEHDGDPSAPESEPGSDLSHRHAPNQPSHSHDMDIWGLFSNLGLCAQDTLASRPNSVSFLDPPLFDMNSRIMDPFSGSLLRPPIA